MLRVRVSGYDESQEAYSTYISSSYFSRKDRTDQIVFLKSGDMELEKNHSYLLHGQFYQPWGMSQLFLIASSFEHPLAKADGFDGGLDQMLVDVTDREETCLTDHPEFAQMADYYRTAADAVLVTEVSDLAAHYEFHENIYNLAEGEGFRNGDGRVLVMSRELAEAQGLKVGGDLVELSLAAQTGSRRL